jgi:hypothetical protein
MRLDEPEEVLRFCCNKYRKFWTIASVICHFTRLGILYVLDFLGGSSGARTPGHLIKGQSLQNNISDLTPKYVHKIVYKLQIL